MRGPAARRAALLLGAALACAWPGEHEVKAWPTRDAAAADGLFERGWMPDVLPGGAGPILEAHDVDTNARCSGGLFPAAVSRGVAERLRDAGFEAHTGELPALPFPECPFTLERVRASGGTALSRRRTDTADRELAVVGDGVLWIWSSR